MNIVLTQPYSFTQLGKRNNQEDCRYPEQADKETAFFAVCDGVGETDHGEIASELVCQMFGQRLTDEQCSKLKAEDVLVLVKEAYRTLYNNRAACPTMATTLVFMAKTNNGMLLAHLGDSRIYQIRKGKGVVFQTKDHSLVNDLVDSGRITPEEAIEHPKNNVITKFLYVTAKEANYHTPAITLIQDVKPHDVFLICTDGVYSKLTSDDISEILSADCPLKEKSEELAAICKDSCDNNTAYLVEIDTVDGLTGYERNVAYEINKYTQENKKGFWHRLCRELGIVQ